jgi:CheY-like chemotaxis protein
MSRLLWADDQVDVARTLSKDIGSHEVDFVRSGEEAMEALALRFYDFVLIDLRMPPGEWGGLWLLQEMRNRGLFAPAIVISGEGTQSETIRALRLGAIDYVTKEKAGLELGERIDHAQALPAASLESISRRPTADLIGGLETRGVEFKETARWDARRGTKDARIEQAVVKTIAGFFNSSGGTLIIGVTDDGRVGGLQPDLVTFASRPDPVDAFMNWLTTLLTHAFGAADASRPRIRVEDVGGGKKICRVDVPASTHPVFAVTDDDAFFVRYDNSTRKLTPRETMDYVNERWPQTRR